MYCGVRSCQYVLQQENKFYNACLETKVMGWDILWDGMDCRLRSHLKTHTGERPNKCNQCDFASSHARALRTHLKIHSGEKSNKCNQCDYASSTAGNLRTHLKIHSGEKPNKCNQCEYASSMHTIWGDILKHTAEKN